MFQGQKGEPGDIKDVSSNYSHLVSQLLLEMGHFLVLSSN